MKTIVRNLVVGPVIALTLAVPAHSRLHDNGAAAKLAVPGTALDMQHFAQTDTPASGAAQAVDPLPKAQLDSMLKRGEALLMSGNITAARLLFKRIVSAGDPRGAIWVGMTYDPDMYARLPVAGMEPDREQAEFWYKKAGQRPIFPADDNLVATPAKRSKQPTPAANAGSPEWNAACAKKYRSFEPETGQYTSFGGEKKPCRLPRNWKPQSQ
jgi:hypothetical protein